MTSGCSGDFPEEKRLKEFNEDEGDEGDNSIEVFQKSVDMDKLVEKIERISMKLKVLDKIERKMSKLDSIEEKIERFSLSHLGANLNYQKKNKLSYSIRLME